MASAVSVPDRDRQMANGLAHKIRNWLNAMRAHLALLQKFSAPLTESRIPHHVNRLEDAVSGVEELLNEYLAIASPEPNDWQEAELPAVVDEVLRFAALDLEQAGVSFRREFAADVPSVLVDAGKLKRALLNLIVNGRQALEKGGELTVRTTLKPRGWIVVEVADNGCGIPEEERGHIFEPFFSTKPDGLGLGLLVVQRIVSDLRGRLEFDSDVGRGTTFRMTLPTARRLRGMLERERNRSEWLQPVQGEE
jgi:signal transduction histidine kinase